VVVAVLAVAAGPVQIISHMTISPNFPDSCLRLTNRPYADFGAALVVRVTDAEWRNIATNFPERIKTNSIAFFK